MGVEFGIVPLILYKNKELESKKKDYNFFEGKVNKNIINLNINNNYIFNNNILFICLDKSNNVIILKNEILIYYDQKNNKSEFYLNNFQFDLNFIDFEYKRNKLKIENKFICFSKELSLLFIGGLINKSIGIIDVNLNIYNNSYISLPNNEYDIISSIELIENSKKFLICSDIIGKILIFQIYKESEKYGLILLKRLNNFHIDNINQINYNSELNIFCSCSKDGFCYTYSFPDGNIIQRIKEKNDILYIFLINSTLPAIILYVINQLKSYSLDGILLKEYLENDFYSPHIYKDCYENSYLIYVKNIHKISLLSIPFFNGFIEFDFDIEICCFCLSNDEKKLYAVNSKGDKIQTFSK